MLQLATVAQIWPPIEPMKASACKWRTISRLDHIARQVTHTLRPETVLWDERVLPTDKVLKRCFSSYQSHTIIPTEVSNMRIKPTVQSLKRDTILPGRHWMVQDWVPSLRHYGEFKVYIVNLEIVYIAVAKWSKTRKLWEYVTPKQIRTLEEIQ